MVTNNLETERKELNQLCRELLLLDGDIEKLDKKLTRIRGKRDKLYLEIDKKLDGENENGTRTITE